MIILYAIPFTATINWLIGTHDYTWTSFLQHLNVVPLMFAIAIGVRFTIANPIVDKMVKTFVSPKLGCFKRALLITVLNIIVMGTVASFIRALIVSHGLDGFSWAEYAFSLPLSYTISFLFGYFVASPFMKRFFFHTLEPFIEEHPIGGKTVHEVARILHFSTLSRDRKSKAKAA